LSLDASGRSLHERGYRIQDSGAPLKETLAAALVDLSEWDLKTPFIDPMCGSGTLSLEAAIKALNIAPGLFRDRFGFMGWLDYSESLWGELVEKAQNKVKRRLDAPVLGFDQDRYAIAAAIENATRAGLNKSVHFEKRSIESLEPVAGKPAGVVILNPPYGERLGEVEELKGLYKLIGDLFKQRMKGYQGYIFTGNLELAKHVGLRSAKRMILYNGAIECRFLKYTLY
jgi:putative N6-adenine-specific DNA methylase